jgi:GTPase
LAKDQRVQLSVRSEKAILVGVILPESTADPRDLLGELASLAHTAGAEVVDSLIQHRRDIDPGTYIGRGKVEEIAQRVKSFDADVVIFDNDMSPNQLREIEKICNCKILDRSELILDIFGTRARSHEAQLQVALAQLEYTYPRLRHMWAHLERIGAGAGAGVGARGPGEMQLEIDRRLVRDRISELKKRLILVQKRKAREVSTRKEQHFTVSLVGYTNAGKSTLFNTLTEAGAFVEDKLFATLDTKTRTWRLEAAHSALLSDTVGFVRDLPHHLVASFKATLEEATHADLLLIMLDVSHPQSMQQLRSVHQVLLDIGCGSQPALLVLNKIDAVNSADDLSFWRLKFPYALALSAKTGIGVMDLANAVRIQMLGRTLQAAISVPLGDARGITFLEKYAKVISRDYDSKPGRVVLDVRISTRILEQLYNNVRQPEVLKKRLMRSSIDKSGPRAVMVSELDPKTRFTTGDTENSQRFTEKRTI